MAIILLLAAKNWRAAAPRLSETMRVRPEAARNAGAAAADAPEPGDAGSSSRALPDVGDMKRATDRHADQVQEALAEAR
jgi:hypothetical protein